MEGIKYWVERRGISKIINQLYILPKIYGMPVEIYLKSKKDVRDAKNRAIKLLADDFEKEKKERIILFDNGKFLFAAILN